MLNFFHNSSPQWFFFHNLHILTGWLTNWLPWVENMHAWNRWLKVQAGTTISLLKQSQVQDCSNSSMLAMELLQFALSHRDDCPAYRTSLIATRFWVVVICPIIKCFTVLEFSFILFDLCLFITIFNFILNYVPIVTFWIFTYHEIWILLIIFCFITGVSFLWPWLIKRK